MSNQTEVEMHTAPEEVNVMMNFLCQFDSLIFYTHLVLSTQMFLRHIRLKVLVCFKKLIYSSSKSGKNGRRGDLIYCPGTSEARGRQGWYSLRWRDSHSSFMNLSHRNFSSHFLQVFHLVIFSIFASLHVWFSYFSLCYMYFPCLL